MTNLTQKQLDERIIELIPPGSGDTFPQWLDDMPELLVNRGKLKWLLAHTYGGVVWGRHDDAGWRLSSQLDAKWELPPLTVGSLMQMRIFGKKGELFIWRDSDRLRGRAIFDESEQLPPYCQTETHILWGTNGQPENGFTILTDGSQRLLHAFPLLVPQEAFGPFRRPTQLLLRHYVTRHEETGMARITMSRLYDLDYEKPKKKEGKNGSQA